MRFICVFTPLLKKRFWRNKIDAISTDGVQRLLDLET